MKHNRGFTLVELLVVVFVFSLVIGGAMNLLFSAITLQRGALKSAQQLQALSIAGEYMGRALRQAKKDASGVCLTTAGAGFNYELNAAKDRIRFLNRLNLCQQFFLVSQRVYEQISTDSTAANFGAQVALTSSNVQVNSLQFALMGQGQSDNLQPRSTFTMNVQGSQFQTTISQRNFDVLQ